MGYCYAEPTVEVIIPGKEPVVFGYVDVKKADEIIEKYIKGGELVEGIIPVNYKKIDNIINKGGTLSMADYKIHLLVCGGTGCKSSQSQLLADHLRTEIKNQGLDDFAQVVSTGCFGFCEKGPIVKIIPDNTFYTQVKPEDAKEIVEEHIVKGRKVSGYFIRIPKIKDHIRTQRA